MKKVTQNICGIIRISEFLLITVFIILLFSCNLNAADDSEPVIPLPYDNIFDIANPETVFSGTDVFVSKTGDDGNDGSEGAPWATIQRAVNALEPGMRIYVRAGTYNEKVIVMTNGTAELPIILAAYPGEEVTIDGTGIDNKDYTSGLITMKGVNYIVVRDFRVINSVQQGIFAGWSDHVYIRDNYTYNTVTSGIGVWFSSNAVIDNNEVVLACNDSTEECITAAGCDTFIIRNNHVHDSGPGTYGGEGIDAKLSRNGLVYGNEVHDTNRLGIYVDAWNTPTINIKVYNNLVYDCDPVGISVAAEDGGQLEDIQVFNNIIRGSAWYGIVVASWGVEGAPHPIRNIEIVNNTIIDNNSGLYIMDNDLLGTVKIANNLIYRNNGSPIVNEVDDGRIYLSHNQVADEDTADIHPDFVNIENADYHLTADSSAIGAAAADFLPPFDYDGTLRTGTQDIGAFEWTD